MTDITQPPVVIVPTDKPGTDDDIGKDNSVNVTLKKYSKDEVCVNISVLLLILNTFL